MIEVTVLSQDSEQIHHQYTRTNTLTKKKTDLNTP